MSTIEEYLKWSSLARKSISTASLHGYSCIEDFVLKHGRQFSRIGKFPKSLKRGKAKMCYMNATQLSLSVPSLTYCEGYAFGIIPMMHAWCVTRNGTVIDPTWKDGRDYYGVPIKHEYLMRSMKRHGVYGVIDLWQERWPILKAKPETFLQPI